MNKDAEGSAEARDAKGDAALDAYSAVVTAVADRLLPTVASLRVRAGRG